MKYIDKFDELNEKITKGDWRSIRMLPQALFSFLGYKLLNIYPMMGLRYRELKRLKNNKFLESPFSVRDIYILKYEPKKINTLSEPFKSLKIPTLIGWNIYLIETEKRDLLFFTKEEIKKGDKIILSDLSYGNLRGTKGLKLSKEDPLPYLVTKFDDVEELKEIENTIYDILLNITDEHSGNISKQNVYLDPQKEVITVNVEFIKPENYNDIKDIYNETFDRIKSFLSTTVYKNHLMNKGYRIYNEVHYKGDKMREDLKNEISKYVRSWGYDSDIYNNTYNTYNIKMVSDRYLLDDNDLQIFLNDKENLSKNYTGTSYRPENDIPTNPNFDFEIKSLRIEIKKDRKR